MYIHENEVRFGIKIDMDTYVRGFVLMIDKMSSIWCTLFTFRFKNFMNLYLQTLKSSHFLAS